MNLKRLPLAGPIRSAGPPPADGDELTDDFQEYPRIRGPMRGRRSKHVVSVGRTAVGKGIFARKNIRKDEIVGEIEGEIITDADYGSDYCFKLGDRHRLEPEPPFRFVNHSCDPNCEFDWIESTESGARTVKKRAFLIALMDIRRGEQLTIDYNWSARAAIVCRCQSPNCRGWIVDEDQLEELVNSSSLAGEKEVRVRG